MHESDHAPDVDGFGNAIDNSVGYARGRILSSGLDEVARLRHAQSRTAAWIDRHGRSSVRFLTGSSRHFAVSTGDPGLLCNEWLGPGYHTAQLQQLAAQHLGGSDGDAFVILNRTTAAIVATLACCAQDAWMVSVVPDGGRSHPSVRRGAALARAAFREGTVADVLGGELRATRPAVVVVTTVSSALQRIEDDEIRAVVEWAHDRSAIVLLDEAYGARLRPVFFGGRRSLELGADLAVTNSDKAGLDGPRSGILGGRADLVARVFAWASERGMEARAPLSAAVVCCLRDYRADALRDAARRGQEITRRLSDTLGPIVTGTVLGPKVHEDDVLRQLTDSSRPAVTPGEATAALGLLLVDHHGIVTANSHGQPGASASLRLKPVSSAQDPVAFAEEIVTAVLQELDALRVILPHPDRMAATILGAAGDRAATGRPAGSTAGRVTSDNQHGSQG